MLRISKLLIAPFIAMSLCVFAPTVHAQAAPDAGEVDSAVTPGPVVVVPAPVVVNTPAPAETPASSNTPSVIDAPPAADVSAVQKLWRSGALLGAGIVALYLLLTTFGNADPKRALLWTGVAAALGATVDTIIGTGQSPNLSMLIMAGTSIAGIVAKYRSIMKPPAAPPASPDDAATPPKGTNLTALVVLLGFSVGALAISSTMTGCDAVKRDTIARGVDIYNCMSPEVATLKEQFGPAMKSVVLGAIGNDGSVDLAPIKEVAAPLKTPASRCVLAAAIKEVASLAGHALGINSSPLPIDAKALETGFQSVSAELYGGAKFKVDETTTY